jgi:hypothetical protein
MITRIFHRERFINVNPNEAPSDTRQLDSFLCYNCARKCFLKGEGGWYKITAGGVKFVSRTLYLLSLKEWLEIALDDNFISNTK